MNNKKYLSIALILAGLVTVAVPALADSKTNVGNPPPWSSQGENMRQGFKPAITGTVSAINGSTITISAKNGLEFGKEMNRGKASTSTKKTAPSTVTYTVDASSATIMKNSATSSISNIVVGDTIMVQGTVSGTNIKAAIIRDGILGKPGQMDRGGERSSTSTLPIQGNGQPIVAGTISAINGSTVIITNKSNITYTVDATNAKIAGGPNVTAISNLKVGDSVVVQGTVNGTSVIASSVIDQTKSQNNNQEGKTNQGVFGRIGGFFKHLFGF